MGLDIEVTCSRCGDPMTDSGIICEVCHTHMKADGAESDMIDSLQYELQAKKESETQMKYLMSRMQDEKDKMEGEINDALSEIAYYRDIFTQININPSQFHLNVDDDGRVVVDKRDDPNAGLNPEVGHMLDTISHLEHKVSVMKETIERGKKANRALVDRVAWLEKKLEGEADEQKDESEERKKTRKVKSLV